MRWLGIVPVATLLMGCATSAPSRPATSAAQTREAFAPTCAEPDARTRDLVARMSVRNEREGFYARAELKGLARDRDELVGRLVARHRQLKVCLAPGRERDDTLADSARLMYALLDGRSPADGETALAVTDLRRPPRAFPIYTGACEAAHGLEGAAACWFLYWPVLVPADLVTFPLGSWLWAGLDRKQRLELGDTFPPPPTLVSAVDEVTKSP